MVPWNRDSVEKDVGLGVIADAIKAGPGGEVKIKSRQLGQ
jgi:hypothetical protein